MDAIWSFLEDLSLSSKDILYLPYKYKIPPICIVNSGFMPIVVYTSCL